MANGRYIIAAAKTLKLPQQAAAIGIMAAQQGSDHDSIGLFQQRPSREWGPSNN